MDCLYGMRAAFRQAGVLVKGLAAALFVLAATASAAADAPDVAGFIERLDSLREDANIPGLSVAVVKDREVLLATGLGYADVANGIPATADTPYDIASVAKPLSAVVALRLVEDGALGADHRCERDCLPPSRHTTH